MLTLTFRPLEVCDPQPLHLDQIPSVTADLLADLTQAEIVTTVTPILGAEGQEVARQIRWHTYATRDRLVIESTWHFDQRTVVFDAVHAAVDYHRFAAIWTLCQQGARAGYTWAAAWWEGAQDSVLDNLWFSDADELWRKSAEEPVLAPFGRKELKNGLVLEWLHPSVRIMSRLIYFGEECKIDWESLIIEDLMTNTPATYLELREGKNTVALARVLLGRYLPGMEGYDPRSKRPAIEMEIESFEVHPNYQGKRYGAILVDAVQALRRPVSTLDTYRRAQPFWQRMGFVRNPHRSSREDSNIFEWTPSFGEAVKSRTDEDE